MNSLGTKLPYSLVRSYPLRPYSNSTTFKVILMALMAKQSLIILVTVIAFGILVPWYKGFTMLDARMIAAYGCLALLFVAPASAESSKVGFARILTIVAFGWGVTVVTMVSALITLTVAYGHGQLPPVPYDTAGAILICSLTTSLAIAGLTALLARRFTPQAGKTVLRFLFLLVLAALVFSSRLPDRWQIFLADHTTRRSITRLAWEGSIVCAVIAALLLIPLARIPSRAQSSSQPVQ